MKSDERGMMQHSPKNELTQRRIKNHAVADECASIIMQKIFPSEKEDIDFEQTPRNRPFMSSDPLKHITPLGVMRPLARPLFGIDAGENLAGLQEAINGKRILLVGGGRSMQDLTDSKQFAPAALVNVDPHLPHEKITRGLAPYYRSLPLDPTSKDFVAEIQKAGYGKFDEIWSTFSIPHYCKSAEEVETFFANAYELLDADGNIRDYPVAFYTEALPLPEMLERSHSLVSGFASALHTLADKDDLVLSARNNSRHDEGRVLTLLVHKLDKKKS